MAGCIQCTVHQLSDSDLYGAKRGEGCTNTADWLGLDLGRRAHVHTTCGSLLPLGRVNVWKV